MFKTSFHEVHAGMVPVSLLINDGVQFASTLLACRIRINPFQQSKKNDRKQLYLLNVQLQKPENRFVFFLEVNL